MTAVDTRPATRFTDLGGPLFVFALAVAAIVGLLARRQWQLAGYLAVAGLGEIALVRTLKLLVGLLRRSYRSRSPRPVATASPAATRSARSSRTARCCWPSCRSYRAARGRR